MAGISALPSNIVKRLKQPKLMLRQIRNNFTGKMRITLMVAQQIKSQTFVVLFCYRIKQADTDLHLGQY